MSYGRGGVSAFAGSAAGNSIVAVRAMPYLPASAVMPQWLRKDRGVTWAEFGAGRQNRAVYVWEELFGLGCLEVVVTKRVCRELELGGLRLKSSVLYKPGAYCGLGEESPRDGPSCGWDW